jgi:hypothetical protein
LHKELHFQFSIYVGSRTCWRRNWENDDAGTRARWFPF